MDATARSHEIELRAPELASQPTGGSQRQRRAAEQTFGDCRHGGRSILPVKLQVLRLLKDVRE